MASHTGEMIGGSAAEDFSRFSLEESHEIFRLTQCWWTHPFSAIAIDSDLWLERWATWSVTPQKVGTGPFFHFTRQKHVDVVHKKSLFNIATLCVLKTQSNISPIFLDEFPKQSFHRIPGLLNATFGNAVAPRLEKRACWCWWSTQACRV